MSAVPRFPLRVYFDGACPVCAREVEHYRRRDRAGRLVPIDISAPGFDPGSCGLSRAALEYELHAIDRLGTIYRGVDAFRAIWQAYPEAPGYRALALLVALPLIRPLARLCYWGFARLRPHLPGRGARCAGGVCHSGDVDRED